MLVTRTNVIVPRRRKDLLSRARLIDMLHELSDLKLNLIIAPAGYGKTSLLVDFAHRTDLPVCWYSIDALDSDPLRFLAHFILAIQQRFPDFGQSSNAALEAANPINPDVNQLADVCVNDAYDHILEHFLLVLDDFHLVQNLPPIAQFVNRFILKTADNCHLVLASRTLITLPDLPLLVARSQVGGLGYEELAFRADEIQNLILQLSHTTLSAETAQNLVDATEGWITGLLMTDQAGLERMADRLRTERVSGVGLYNYLAHQVFERQDASLREFMMQTAFLEEFSADLCEEVWGKSADWSSLINTLLKENLFVLPVGEDALWLRYHHLLRDFLQSQYKVEHPEQFTSLLQSIANTYARREEWEKAFTIYKNAGDLNACADLVERAGTSLIRNFRFSTLASWLEALPLEIVNARPKLLSHQGAVLLIQGHVARSLDYLNQAETSQRTSGDQAGLARTLARRATAFRYLGKYSESILDGSQALELAGKNEELLTVRAEAFRSIGMSLYHLGQLNKAIEHFTYSLNAYQRLEERQNVALVNMELGMCYRSAGSFQQALKHYERALSYWREVQNTARQSYVLNNLGVLHYYSGNYVEAGKLLDEALAYARHNNLARSEAYILCSLGDLYADLNVLKSARDAYYKTQEIARKIDDRFLLFYIVVAEAALARQEGEIPQASAFIASAKILVEASRSPYEKGLWSLEAGQIYLAERKPIQAVQSLKESTDLLESGGQIIEAARAYLHLAQACRASGQQGDSRSALRKAFELADKLDNLQPLIVAGRSCPEILQDALVDPELCSSASILVRQIEVFENENSNIRRQLRSQSNSVLLAPPKINLLALGRSQVEIDGKPVTSVLWTNQKRARDLFFFILAHPTGIAREEIGEKLWPESSRTQLGLQFKNAIYRLRSALGQDVISYEDNRYRFNRELDYTYDVELFEEAVEQGRDSTSPKDQIRHLRNALKIYLGSYYPEGEGNWVWVERQRIEAIYLEAAYLLIRLLQEGGQYRVSIPYCQRILDEDPCREEAHRLAMKSYAAIGDRTAVAKQYEECRKALQEEMGTQPSTKTKALYKMLK